MCLCSTASRCTKQKKYFNNVEIGFGNANFGLNKSRGHSGGGSNNVYSSKMQKPVAAGLAKGDLAVIGMNGDVDFTGSTVRSFAVVALSKINASEVIKITDRGWINTYGSVSGHFVGGITIPTPSSVISNEGILQWKPSQDIAAGTIIIIKISLADRIVSATEGDGVALPAGDFSILPDSWTNTNLTANPWPAGTGDQLIIYQGNEGSPSFIYAFNNLRNNSTNISNGWFVNPSGFEPSTQLPIYCELPSDLGTAYSVSFLTPMTDSRYSDVKYNPSSATGTKAAILADIANTTKWINTVLPGGVAYDFSLGFGSGDTKYFKFTISGNSTAPTVITSPAASIGATKAVLGGSVSTDGGAAVTDRGIVWATTYDPTISDNKVSNGTGTGAFSASVSSLPAASLIHFRAFATNSAGTSYGSDLIFTTKAALSGTITKTDVSCFGGSNGTAEVNITGGSAPYIYSWSPYGGTASKATGLTQGTYVCTITDSESTQITRSITIAQPASVVSGTTVVTNVSCNGASNGAINLTPAGGTAPYTFNWGGGVTTEDRTALSAGTYTVTITDFNGCTATVDATVTQPNILSSTASQTNVSCNGGSNGTATINVSGGTPIYTYSWSPSGGNGATATGLIAGTYTVTVKDANLCQITKSFIITEPAAIESPTGMSAQSFNSGDTLSVLVVNGQNIKWYATAVDASDHINALPTNTLIVNNTTYYATQTIGICESKSSLPVKAFNETLGIGTISGEFKIKIYPNPVKDILHLSGNEKINKVIIMSIDGKKVSEKMMGGERTINLHSLIQGPYLIKIFTDQGVQTIKFIKN